MKTTFAVTFCVLLLLVPACAPKVNDPADVQAIKDMAPAFDAAVKAADADGVASFFTDDALRMLPNQPMLVGKDAIRNSAQKFFEQFSEEDHNVVEDVRISGDLAVARGTFEGTDNLKAGGYSGRFKGNWVEAFQRQADGSWKAFWNIGALELPVADSLFPGEEEQALIQTERDCAAAFPKNDWAAIDKILAAEHANNVEGTIFSKKQTLANMKSGAYKVESANTSEMKVLTFGETGIVHGLWTEKSTLNGKDSSGTYRYTDIFEKRDGRWQCVSTYTTKVQ